MKRGQEPAGVPNTLGDHKKRLNALEFTAPAGGIAFDTDNEGGWLYVQVNDETESGGSIRGYALDLQDHSTSVGGSGGIRLKTFNDLKLESNDRLYLLAHSAKVLIESELVTAFGSGQNSVDIKAFGGRIDIHGDSLEVQDTHGATLVMDGTGTVGISATNGISFTGDISFFGVTVAPQQSTPVTLADVIALLQVYGLSA